MAEPTPAPRGTSTRPMPSFSASARGVQRRRAAEGDQRAARRAPCRARPRGRARRWPCSRRRSRTTPSAAIVGVEAERRADVAPPAPARAASGVERHACRRRSRSASMRPSTRSASVTVGVARRRGRSTPARARRPRCPGPTVMRPMRVDAARCEPPPAPISTISITGMRSGRPAALEEAADARRPRSCARVCGRAVARSGRSWPSCRPCRTTARCARRAARATSAARIAPPAGPDSTRRIGNRARRRRAWSGRRPRSSGRRAQPSPAPRSVVSSRSR